MANQRSPLKRTLSCYVDMDIKRAIQDVSEVTQFVEYCVTRGLLVRKQMTRAQILKLSRQRRISPYAIQQLSREGLL